MTQAEIARQIAETAAKIAKYEDDIQKEKKEEERIAGLYDELKSASTGFENELNSTYHALMQSCRIIDAPNTILAKRMMEKIQNHLHSKSISDYFDMLGDALKKTKTDVEKSRNQQFQLRTMLEKARDELTRLNAQKDQTGGIV